MIRLTPDATTLEKGLPPLRQNPLENRLLHVEAVFRLVEDGGGVGLERLVVDFLAAIGRQAVHHQGSGIGQLHQGTVDLVAGQQAEALG